MKKVQKALALGLCLALGVGSLVACGDKDGDNGKKPAAVPYWLAGTIQGEAAWGDDAGAVADETHRFVKTDTANVFTLTLDLWQGDTFKVRYENKSWDEFQLHYDNSFDATQKADPDCKFNGDDGYPGQKNYGVNVEGNYTITLDMTGETGKITYTYNGEAENKQPHPLTKLELDVASLTMELNTTSATHQLVPKFTPANADERDDIMYESSNTAVVTVSETGLVTAVAKGTATITVECADKEVEIPVRVLEEGEAIYAESVTLDATTATLHIGGTQTLTATVSPDDVTDKTIAWTSSKEEVVTVDATGKLTAVGPGTATITATNGSGDNAKSATCEVTVVADYCLVGSSPSPAFDGKSWVAEYATPDAVPSGILFTQDPEDATKWTLDIDLYVGSEIKVISVGGKADWSGLTLNMGGATALANTATEVTAIEAGEGNITVTDDGKYRIILTVPEEGDPTLSYQYLGEAEVLSITTDIRIKGGYNSWGETSLCAAGLNETDGLTATFTVKYVGEVAGAFGIYTTATGKDTQLSWARDQVTLTPVEGITNGESNWVMAAGVYEFTVTVDKAGNITALTVTAGTEDENTVTITYVAPATEE